MDKRYKSERVEIDKVNLQPKTISIMKKIKFITTIVFCTILSQSYAQDYVKVPDKPIGEPSLEKTITVLNFISIGVSQEIRLNSLESFHLSLSTGGTFNSTNSVTNPNTSTLNYALFLVPKADFRHYYNFSKRLLNNKNITQNSGNYLALRLSYELPVLTGGNPVYNRNLVSIGPVWGMQRSYKGGICLGLSVGPGVSFNDSRAFATVLSQFHLGIILGSQKN